MKNVNAYVGFNGKCREAMNFYKECFGGELFLMKVGDSPMKDNCPAGTENDVLHSSLINNDVIIVMGTDMSAGDYHYGNNIALSMNCSSEEEINDLFKKLSEGGKVIDSLKPQFWGSIFGVVEDKFGISWMFNYETNVAK